MVLSAVEQLRQGVLQHRQRARLLVHLGGDGRHQPGFQADAHLLGGQADRALDILRRHGHDGFGPLAHQLAEVGMHQRAVVEVGAQGDNHAQRAARFGDGGVQAVHEVPRLGGILDQGEDLFELIHDEQQMALVVGQGHANGPQQPPLILTQHRQQVQSGRGRHPVQRDFDLFQRVRAGQHLGDEPGVRAGQAPFTQRGDQPCPHHARFAAPARSDHGQEARKISTLRQSRQ